MTTTISGTALNVTSIVSPTLTAPVLGTPASGDLTNCTGNLSNCTGVQYTGFKNRIINGAMVIDQRNAGASVTPTTGGYYSIDRWRASLSVSSKYSMQQNAGSVTPPVGFMNYLGITSTSAYTVIAGDYFRVMQAIEGFNTADLSWGTANAHPVTLSFWVRSSLTGTFSGTLQNNSGTRSYAYSYTISVANTWEQKTITIVGDTTGTWLTSTGTGIFVGFGLGSGSTYSLAAGAWAAGDFTAATGATSVVGTSGATFYITGVQLEKSSTATSFDYRPYGTELALCQRYYYVLASLGGSTKTLGPGFYANSLRVDCPVTFKTSMRASPTLVQVTGTNFYNFYVNNALDGFNGWNDASDVSTEGADLYCTTNVSGASGAAGQVTATISGYIAFQAEL